MPWNSSGGFTYDSSDEDQRYLAEMNARRAKMGLPPIKTGDTVSLDDINKARAAGSNSPDNPNATAPLNSAAQTPQDAEITRKNDPTGGMNTPFNIGGSDPGAQLDTSMPEDDRARTEQLLSQLQQQAATGGGAWEATLQSATQRAQQTASAVGQSQTNEGGNYQSGLRNIGNAESAAAQRAVGQGNVLRAQSKLDAQSQLSGILAAQGAQDAATARSEGAARQATREANETLSEAAAANRLKTTKAAGDTAMSVTAAMSDGGRVPGRPFVFGDDSRNDTVPAMLSPQEIVIPVSAAKDPEKAADFARAEARLGASQHLADGGAAWKPGDPDSTSASGMDLNWLGGTRQAPSVENGGVLHRDHFDASRAANLANDDVLSGMVAGNGPTATGQMMQDSTDDTIAGTMQAQQRGAAASEVMASAVRQLQNAGGDAAGERGNETSRALRQLSHSRLSQRERDLSFSEAMQQAAFKNSMMNTGVGLEQQSRLMGIIGGAAQAASGVGGLLSGDKGDKGPYSTDFEGERGGPADLGRDGQFSSEEDQPRGDHNPPSEGGAQYAAHGGIVMDDDERARTHRFLRMLGRKAA